MIRCVGSAAFCAALLVAGAATAQQDMRSITGTLTYLQRMAIPEASALVVELKDSAGAVVGETRTATEGRQVPLAFDVEGPADVDLVFRGGIVVDGRPAWTSEPIAIGAGTADVDLGEVRLEPFFPMGFASALRCGATEVVVGFVENEARMEARGRRFALRPVPAASGARYELADDPSTFFWSRGDRALVGLDGEVLPECVMAEDAAIPVLARGNEPGWQLRLSDDRLVLVTDYGDTRLETRRPEPEAVDGGSRYAVPSFGLAATVTDRLCRDDMTGMPYPGTVVLELADRTLRGCAGEARDLLVGGEWTVTDLVGADLVPDHVPTLAFGEAGGLFGTGGCNRYRGDYTLTGEGLSFGPAASTMMACPEPQMRQEQHFLTRLEDVTAFDIDGDGALVLIGAAGPVLTARR